MWDGLAVSLYIYLKNFFITDQLMLKLLSANTHLMDTSDAPCSGAQVTFRLTSGMKTRSHFIHLNENTDVFGHKNAGSSSKTVALANQIRATFFVATKENMNAPVITFQSSKIHPHNIINHCAVFWYLMSLQAYGSVTQTQLSGLSSIVSSVPKRKSPNQRVLCILL